MSKKVPEFKLYKENNQFSVLISSTENKVTLNVDQFELLKKTHVSIFSDLLSINFLQNFEDSAYGGFILFFKPSKSIHIC
jgi:hypothetical protein